MADLQQLRAQRDALEAARFKGVKTVTYDNKTVVYKSDAEMASALAALSRRIAAAEGRSRRRVHFISTSKGV